MTYDELLAKYVRERQRSTRRRKALREANRVIEERNHVIRVLWRRLDVERERTKEAQEARKSWSLFDWWRW